ncbi:hypothetical protein [Streptomyces sp. NPDC048295]
MDTAVLDRQVQRELWLHFRWGGRLFFEELRIPNGTLVLQELWLIPSV